VELARSLIAAGKTEDASAATDRALTADPGDLMALTLKFGAADPNDLELVQKTIAPLTAYAEKHPTSAGAIRALARAKLTAGATDDALDLLAKAVALAPADEDLRTEYWGELSKAGRYDAVIADAEALPNRATCNWGLRWSEAESYASLGRKMEARTLFTQINSDASLHVDVRKRAKRAAMGIVG
jgi:tetratricopeptide (TPR) repeat protein